MKHLKTFENHNEPDSWLIPLKDEDLDIPIFQNMPDIRDKVKEGDIVIGVWFGGGFEAFLCKVENDPNEGLGCSDDTSWYGLEDAYAVYDPKEYDLSDHKMH